jgi:hypothetical protein
MVDKVLPVVQVFSGLSNPGLSRKIARYVGVTLGRADFTLCSNGEPSRSVSIEEKYGVNGGIIFWQEIFKRWKPKLAISGKSNIWGLFCAAGISTMTSTNINDPCCQRNFWKVRSCLKCSKNFNIH